MTVRNSGVVLMSEWQTIGPSDDPHLADSALAADEAVMADAERFSPNIAVRSTKGGISITTTSWVGQVSLGPIQLVIVPKLPGMPLAVLLAYAYRLRNLQRDPYDSTLVSQNGLQGLLALMFAQEMEGWYRQGPPKCYVGRDEHLTSPRGRLLIGQIIRQGGVVEARLPCYAMDRSVNWSLNQVLKAGLRFVASLELETDLRNRLQRWWAASAEIEDIGLPSVHDIEQARAGLTRLTDHWAPALSILELLLAGYGAGTDAPSPRDRRPPGYLFDMNMFFQRLLSRFIHDHAAEYQPVDEGRIRGMFRHETPVRMGYGAPAPRPDLAVRDSSGAFRYLDAKYKDLWSNKLTATWLYQLSIYAMASRPATSVLLYATTSSMARDDVISVTSPGPSSALAGRVIVRPVSVERLAELVTNLRNEAGRREARAFASGMLAV